MRVANFEDTGLKRLEAWLERNKGNSTPVDELSLMEVLRTVSISFILEGIDRVQSTLICELKDSYVQQSQRYVALSQDAYNLPALDENDDREGQSLFARAFHLYGQMSALKEGGFQGRPKEEHYLYGIPIEDARYILPLAAKTNISVAIAGDKLFAFFRLLRDQAYGNTFADLVAALAEFLPAGLAALLPDDFDSRPRQALAEDFYSEYFTRINDRDNVVFFDSFQDLTLKAGLGALTSTSKDPPSVILEKWGPDHPEKARGVVERVLGYGHESIAEQARTTFGLMCSMVTYHQQLRHRLYQNYREDLVALIRDTERAVKIPDSIRRSVFCPEFQRLADEFKAFRAAVERKYGADKALPFLLNCDQIRLITTSNARADAMMLKERTCMNAQWEIRDLARKKLACLRKRSPVLYEKALPSCVYGKCREGNLSCGRQTEVRNWFLGS